MEQPYYGLKLASENYWAGQYGSECAPAPSYRTINGKEVLGRYLDQFGCEACMVWSRQNYKETLHRILGIMAICGAASLLDPVFLFVILPLCAFILWMWRGRYSKHFNYYYEINEEIQRTGQPVWAPFDRIRLNFMKTNPNSVWP